MSCLISSEVIEVIKVVNEVSSPVDANSGSDDEKVGLLKEGVSTGDSKECECCLGVFHIFLIYDSINNNSLNKSEFISISDN